MQHAIVEACEEGSRMIAVRAALSACVASAEENSSVQGELAGAQDTRAYMHGASGAVGAGVASEEAVVTVVTCTFVPL